MKTFPQAPQNAPDLVQGLHSVQMKAVQGRGHNHGLWRQEMWVLIQTLPLCCVLATDFTSLSLSLVMCQKGVRITESQGCCRDQSGDLKEPGQAGDAAPRGGDPSKDTNEASLSTHIGATLGQKMSFEQIHIQTWLD